MDWTDHGPSVWIARHTSFDLLMDEIHSLNSTIDYTGTTLSTVQFSHQSILAQ